MLGFQPKLIVIGDADAQFELSQIYASGWDIPERDEKSIEWLLKAADQGHARARYELAMNYAIGLRGLAEDKEKAAEWFRKAAESYLKAAEQGDANAQFQLAEMYSVGWGVPKDSNKVFEWYLKAAEQGHADAQFQLGHIYLDGKGGIPKNRKKAAEWYSKAAEQGHEDAQDFLSAMYNNEL